jgi:hypothetical protein
LAYLGSILLKGRAIRGFGLPSGSEYLVIGFVLGAHVFAVIDRQLVAQFQPVAAMGMGWLSFRVGISYLSVGTRTIRISRLLLGNLLSLLVTVSVAAVVFFVGRAFSLSVNDLGFLALGVGLIAADNTRHSVRWVAEQCGASGPITELVGDLARCSALLPILGATLLFAVAPGDQLVGLPFGLRVGFPLLLGIGLGGVLLLLLGRELRKNESWGLLLGTCLLAAGACLQLGLSSIASLFILGLVISFSKHRWDLKAMIAPTEQPVLLPMLLLAGASVNVQLPTAVLLLLLIALIAKLALRVLFGALVVRRFVPSRAIALRIGISQMSCGVVSVIISTGIAARSNSALGNALLLFTAACMLLGEAIGPARLRQVLDEVDEIAAADSAEHSESLAPESEMLKLKVGS